MRTPLAPEVSAKVRADVRAVCTRLAPVIRDSGITGKLSIRVSNLGSVIVDVDVSATHGNYRQDLGTVQRMVADACAELGYDAQLGVEDVVVRPFEAEDAAPQPEAAS